MNKFNICLIKPINYKHTNAFLEIAELINFSLQDLGYESFIKYNHIDVFSQNIIIGLHLIDIKFINQIPKTTIIFNTEQILYTSNVWKKNILEYAKKFKIWDYSENNISYLASLGYKNINYFRIGFQKKLVRLRRKNQDIDILFYGSLDERRKNILSRLSNLGLKVKTLFGVYSRDRDDWIERSKIVLNLHYKDFQIFEIIRVFYLMTNSVCFVSEISKNTIIDKIYMNKIFFSDYERLPLRCLELVKDNNLRLQIETEGYETISKYPQKEFIKGLIST